MTQRYKLTIAYDGTEYAGWQVQPSHRTVLQTIEGAETDGGNRQVPRQRSHR